MRLILVLAATGAVAFGIVWLGTRLVAAPAQTVSPAQAAKEAKLERDYIALVRRLRARGRRARRIKAARTAWARRANKICVSEAREIEKVAAAFGPVRAPSQVLELLSKLEPIQSDGLLRLRATPPPPHDAAEVKKMNELYAQALSLGNAGIYALRRNDRAGFLRLMSREPPVAERADAIAAALGADVCAGISPALDG